MKTSHAPAHYRYLIAAIALIAPGCQGLYVPRIDPSGQRLFACVEAPPIQDPKHVLPRSDSSITVTPCRVTAPVGSEVIFQGTVCGKDGCMMANQHVEWSLDPGGVGHFVTFGQRSAVDVLAIGDKRPRKVDNTFVIAATSSKNHVLNRGTPTTDDDIRINRGQSWVSVTSAVEGTSYVTAFANDVYGWDARQGTGYIEWIDARWSFPPPAVNPSGSRHVFTTTVTRQSSNLPITGWRVRYEITGGPAAGFAPTGARVVEVNTDELGQARAEIFQQQPSAGTNTISIQIIRPAELSSTRSQYVVATGATTKTWTTPEIFLRKTGPAEGSVGSTLTYRIEVRNPSDLTAREVVVSEEAPQGLVFLSANPAPAVTGNRMEWRLGDLRALEGRSIDLSFRADRAGTVQNCASVATADGLSARDCATTTILVPTIEVTLQSPPTAVVGQDVTFTATISNRGAAAATGLVVVARFDPGFVHTRAASPIERPLEDLAPGESRVVTVNLRAVQTGQPCATIEVFGDQGVKATQSACVQVAPAASGAPPTVPPPPTTPSAPTQPGPTAPPASTATPPAEPPQLTVTKRGPTRRTVGEQAAFDIEVRNIGRGPATNVEVTDSYDDGLYPRLAAEGYEIVGQDLRWRIPTLAPGDSRLIQIVCDCESAGLSCNRVTVTCTELVRADAEACVEIAAPQARLSLSVSDLRDPLSAGNDGTYEIRLTNNQAVPDQQVALTVTLSPEVRPTRVGTEGPAENSIQGQTVRFDPIAELRAGESVLFRVRVNAVGSGTATCTATVQSAAQTQPITAREETTVFGN